MYRAAALALLLVTLAAPALAQSRLLSAYGGGGGGYYQPIRGNTSFNGYTGASAPISRAGSVMGAAGGWWGNEQMVAASLPSPCGNFQRAAARCRATTQAWDESFISQRNW